MTRIFRNNKYKIIYKRIGKGNEVSLVINGNKLSSNVIPLPQEIGKIITVFVELGSKPETEPYVTEDIIISKDSTKKGE